MAEPAEARTAFSSRWLRVDVERWPDVGEWEVVRVPDAAAVLPVTPHDQVVLVRQFRAPARGRLTEIPAGMMDVDGEDAVACATRELLEETGYRHTAIEFLGGMYPMPGLSTHHVQLFWARTAADPGPPEDGIEVVERPLEEMIHAARSGRVRDGKTALALLMAAGRPALPLA